MKVSLRQSSAITEGPGTGDTTLEVLGGKLSRSATYS